MGNHTSGPWIIHKKQADAYRYNVGNTSTHLAEVGGGATNNSETLANARIIAAAPEMYELLKGLDISEISCTSPQFAKQIESLINRIDGE